LELLLVFCARNVDTINNDSHILREEVVEGVGEVLVIGGFVDRGDVALGPLSEGREHDGSGHGYWTRYEVMRVWI